MPTGHVRGILSGPAGNHGFSLLCHRCSTCCAGLCSMKRVSYCRPWSDTVQVRMDPPASLRSVGAFRTFRPTCGESKPQHGRAKARVNENPGQKHRSCEFTGWASARIPPIGQADRLRARHIRVARSSGRTPARSFSRASHGERFCTADRRSGAANYRAAAGIGNPRHRAGCSAAGGEVVVGQRLARPTLGE